jgi:hypothetical protein
MKSLTLLIIFEQVPRRPRLSRLQSTRWDTESPEPAPGIGLMVDPRAKTAAGLVLGPKPDEKIYELFGVVF